MSIKLSLDEEMLEIGIEADRLRGFDPQKKYQPNELREFVGIEAFKRSGQSAPFLLFSVKQYPSLKQYPDTEIFVLRGFEMPMKGDYQIAENFLERDIKPLNPNIKLPKKWPYRMDDNNNMIYDLSISTKNNEGILHIVVKGTGTFSFKGREVILQPFASSSFYPLSIPDRDIVLELSAHLVTKPAYEGFTFRFG